MAGAIKSTLRSVYQWANSLRRLLKYIPGIVASAASRDVLYDYYSFWVICNKPFWTCFQWSLQARTGNRVKQKS